MTALIPRPGRRGLGALRRNMDSLWDRFLMDPVPFAQTPDTPWFPAADINDNEKEVIVTAELPGLDPENVDVKVSGDLLTIRGEKKREQDEENYYERYFGSFERSFQLPSEVSSENADARFKNGVLKITLPKSESESRKSIKIKAE